MNHGFWYMAEAAMHGDGYGDGYGYGDGHGYRYGKQAKTF